MECNLWLPREVGSQTKFKDNMNKQLNEIRSAMQDMEKEFNKDIEILKKNLS
jgi:hypothetical protein